MTVMTRRDLFLASAALAAAPALAQTQSEPFRPFVSRHSGVFNGRRIDYVATVGETVIRDDKGQPTVRFVATSYVAAGMKATDRPVLFVFNGGPSAASVILHMLALGPKRVVVGQDPAAPEKPTQTADNELSLLDAADLVFVDPAETGFSRILPAGRREVLYSVNGDAQSVSDFVVAWCRANGREASPKFVLGESYGTIRAAIMAGLGFGFLPCVLGDTTPGLVRVGPVVPELNDELWLLTHQDIRKSWRVKAFMAFCAAAVAEQKALVEGQRPFATAPEEREASA